MIHTKRFIDRVSHMEARSAKDLILPIAEARGLRDELAKMMADNCRLMKEQLSSPVADPIIKVEIVGGKF